MTDLTPDSVTGQNGWMWDNPAVPHRPSVRTVRPGLPIVYYVGGTYTDLNGNPNPFPFDFWMWPALPPSQVAPRGSFHPVRTCIDLSRVEFVNIPYPGSAYPMDKSIKAGNDYLTQLIRRFPGDFMLSGVSQGGSVISQVYDRLRTGDLRTRRSGFVGAAVWGNTRKEQGRTFTDPVFGKCFDGAPTKSGMWKPNLTKTEDLWWELFDPDDVVACCENDPNGENYQRDKWVRREFQFMMRNYLGLLIPLLIGPNSKVKNEQAAEAFREIKDDVFTSDPNNTSPHHRLWLTKPFESQGDDRTHAEVMIDYLNSSGDDAYVGTKHTFLDKKIPVTGGVVNISGDAFWVNVDTPERALSIGLNCYDGRGNLAELRSDNAAVKNPSRYQLDPVTLSASFAVPPSTVFTRIACEVEPAAMDSGIVWFTNLVSR